jgi:hypothetical protein
MNRTWKLGNDREPVLRHVTDEMAYTIKSQLTWLHENQDFDLAFISRETSSWKNWFVRDMLDKHGVEFKTSDNRYITCDNKFKQTCWQYIVYQGNDKVLEKWDQQTAKQ